jgi:hypothetical protein
MSELKVSLTVEETDGHCNMNGLKDFISIQAKVKEYFISEIFCVTNYKT